MVTDGSSSWSFKRATWSAASRSRWKGQLNIEEKHVFTYVRIVFDDPIVEIGRRRRFQFFIDVRAKANDEEHRRSTRKFYRIRSHLRTGATKVPLKTTVTMTMIDVVVYISDRACVETLRMARAKAKAPRRPEKMIIICHRQRIRFLRVKFKMNERRRTQSMRATPMAI